MKPRNKLEKHVFELSQKLPKITKVQSKYFKSLHVKEGWHIKSKGVSCTECGHVYQVNKEYTDICPNCNSKLNIEVTRIKYRSYEKFLMVSTTVEDFQVFRLFRLMIQLERNKPVNYYIREVASQWVSKQGKVVHISTNILGSHYSGYYYGTKPKEIKKHSLVVNNYSIYPRKKILPELLRTGFNFDSDYHPHAFASLLFKYPMFETLVKAKYNGVVNQFEDYQVEIGKYWNQIKICIRNKQYIPKFSIYGDYLDLLIYFKKDINNPKYICPGDINAAHDKYVEKKKDFTRKNKLKELREQIYNDNIAYINKFGELLNFKIVKDNMTIRPLKSVSEFYEEGDIMSHCIFENEYYKKGNLIFSAMIDNKKIETIEFDLQKFKVIQSYGIKNSITEFHDIIISLVNKHKPVIKQIIKQLQTA